MTENCQVIKIENDEIAVTPDEKHEWTMDTGLVAKGYGVAPKTIQNHKLNHADELIEGKHFFMSQIMGHGNLNQICWTKRGVVRLGFFIKSQRAKLFRDMAEDLIIERLEQPELFDELNRPKPIDFLTSLEALLITEKERKRLDAKVTTLLPAASYAETIMDSSSLMNTTAVAKPLGVGAPTLNKFLAEKGVLRKNSGEWVPTFKYQGRDDLFKIVTTERTVCVGTKEEHVKTFHQLKFTEAGARFVRELWKGSKAA